MLNFYDYHSTADLSGKIKKTLQWDSLQHRRAVADLCMFHKLKNNLANITIPPMLVPSAKHNCLQSSVIYSKNAIKNHHGEVPVVVQKDQKKKLNTYNTNRKTKQQQQQNYIEF